MYNFKILNGVDITSDKFLLSNKPSAICVTTNGVVKANGELVMGAGVAKAFNDKFNGIALLLGQKVSKFGNHVYHACKYIPKNSDLEVSLLSFPTKHDWRDKADINLIKQSALRLVKWANQTGATKIYIPSPGTGFGGLDKSIVYNVLNDILDERFTIVTK